MSEQARVRFRAASIRSAMDRFETQRLQLSEQALAALARAVDDGVEVFLRRGLLERQDQLQVANTHIRELADFAIANARSHHREILTEEDIRRARESCQFWPFC